MRAGSDPSSKGEPKTIDFAIYLEPDKLMIEAIRTITSRYPSLGSPTSVNQTIHTPLQMRPIAVNIETKRTGEGWDAALLQVGVWVAAQFVKLEQLVTLQEKDVNDIPWLPVVIVQGHDWWFLAASRGEFGETLIWRKISLGTTETFVGIYKVTAGLQYISHRCWNVYRPWFLENCLGLETD